MTDDEILEAAVKKSGNGRFRGLLDPQHPDHDPRYWATAIRLALSAPPPLPPHGDAQPANTSERSIAW
jgi:hypothetical protein